VTQERRTFNTPIREPWNAPIHNILCAIDSHTSLYFANGDRWHLEKAAMLRAYVHELKTYIHAQEAKGISHMGESSREQGE
jgi:hypothetical protein